MTSCIISPACSKSSDENWNALSALRAEREGTRRCGDGEGEVGAVGARNPHLTPALSAPKGQRGSDRRGSELQGGLSKLRNPPRSSDRIEARGFADAHPILPSLPVVSGRSCR